MIPYNGEEVKLIWANMDQYYIKSSELLRDYTFHIRRADIAPGELPLGHLPEEVVVHFKLVEGDTEKDNRKPDGKTTRAFALDDEPTFIEENDTTLTIRFRYREHPAERNLQEKLNADTEKTLADNLPARWKSLLWTTDPTYTGKDKKDTRTLLQKHLRKYTARHQFDYFIHKDLGGFLCRELDFYIKNEIMHLDDIENVAAPKAEEYLSKIRAIRRCAQPVISMLEQLENFQKKLWLKKKFVVETRYCLTLDRIPESLYEIICKNDAQWAEWEQLYVLSELPTDMFTAKPRTGEFLKQQPHLMIDTRHFDRDFTLRLLASIDNLDETLDGVCFHSENFQALQLMEERYREQVKCMYIDPPYNTGSDDFIYKDAFQHSSWVSMIYDRLSVSGALLSESGGGSCHLNDIEDWRLRGLIASNLGQEAYITTVITKCSTASSFRTINTGPVDISDRIILFVKDRSKYSFSPQPVEKPVDLQHFSRFVVNHNDPPEEWKFKPIRLQALHDMGFPCESTQEGMRAARQKWGEAAKAVVDLAAEEFALANAERVFETKTLQKPSPWLREHIAHSQKESERIYVVPRQDGSTLLLLGGRQFYFLSNGVVEIAGKRVLTEPASTLWTDIDTNNLKHEGAVDFSAGKKPLKLVGRLLKMSDAAEGTHYLDYFAGSGTTGHAVINLNRENGGTRKYLLVEMGEYFDTVLVPRLKKVVYSTDWKDGKPQSRNTGISHAFKTVRLESYEDALNNLRLNRTPEQQAALIAAPEEARDGYLISYFLDVESAGSASLLDLDQFRDPFSYTLKIATSSAGETKETPIDLVETFNWLLGLKVKQIDTQKGFLTVTGEKRAGGRTLVIWRTLSEDPVKDNKALEQFLARLQINPADTEFAFIYVNGSHTLADPHNKVHLIEETFARLMFEAHDFETLSA